MQRSQPPFRYWAPTVNHSSLTTVQHAGKIHRVPDRKMGRTVVASAYEENWASNFKDGDGTPAKRLMWRALTQQLRAARAEKEARKAEDDRERMVFERNIKDRTVEVDLVPDMNITDAKLRDEDFKIRCEMENYGVVGAFDAVEEEAGSGEAEAEEEEIEEIVEGVAAL